MKQMKSAFIISMIIMAVFGLTTGTFGQDTESVVVTETGDVGIGTSTPDKKLEVVGDAKINGEVKATGRIKDKTGFVMPVGTILPFGGTTAPEGWLLCDGAAYSRTVDYDDLFAVIGTAFGAPDVNNFNVPDLRGQFLRGTDNGAGEDPDATTRVESKSGGNTGDNVGSKQADLLPDHDHSLNVNSQLGNGSKSYRLGLSRTLGIRSISGTETRPKNVNVNYIIKY